MSAINVQCTDQTLMITNSPKIASGGNLENNISFSFCNAWTGYTKTAIFFNDRETVYSVLLDENDECAVPNEVTENNGWFYFGVYGVSGTITRTSELLRYKVVEGSLFDGSEPPEPTQDIWEQLLSNYNECVLDIAELDESKAPLEHTHAQSDVNGLETALAGKAALLHTHEQSDVTGLSTALQDKANATHGHAQSDITGLETALAGKAPLVHTHAQSDITGLETTLDNKAATATYIATIPATNWTGDSAPYSTIISVSGVLMTDAPIVDIVQTGTTATDEAVRTNWGKITRITTDAGSITVYADEIPTASIPIQLKVVR